MVSEKGITDSQISWSGEGIKRDKPSSIKMERLLQTHDLMTFTTAPSPSKTLQIKDAKIGLQAACKELRTDSIACLANLCALSLNCLGIL